MTEQEQKCPKCGALVLRDNPKTYVQYECLTSFLPNGAIITQTISCKDRQIAKLWEVLKEAEEVLERCHVLILHYENRLKEIKFESDLPNLYQALLPKIREAVGGDEI